jgi:hypothetical protein
MQAEQQESNEENEDLPYEEHVEELMHDLTTFFRYFPLESHSQSLLHAAEVNPSDTDFSLHIDIDIDNFPVGISPRHENCEFEYDRKS